MVFRVVMRPCTGNLTVKAGNLTIFTQIIRPITELITITIVATTYSTKLENFQNGGTFSHRQCLFQRYFLK